MTAAEKPICVSWRCPRSVECLMHYCHHKWADLVAAKRDRELAEAAEARVRELEALLNRCRPYVSHLAPDDLDAALAATEVPNA